MEKSKIRKIIEMSLLILIALGVIILVYEYSKLNDLMLQLNEGNIKPILDYYSNKTGQECLCFNPIH